MSAKSDIHPDLLEAKTLLYDHRHFQFSTPVAEPESAEYGAYRFELNGLAVMFRVAKTTPKKVGQFVTFWKRIGSGPIRPYDAADEFDWLIISARRDKNFGQFILPKSVLLEKKILSNNGKGGKRALRVYPPWDEAKNQQAKKTQSWQLKYFFQISTNPDLDRLKYLLNHQ